jgi:hypothetical protein
MRIGRALKIGLNLRDREVVIEFFLVALEAA